MLRILRNMVTLDNKLIREGVRGLQERLPPGWLVGGLPLEPALLSVDALAELRAPDGRTGVLALEARARVEPRDVAAIVSRTEALRSTRTLVLLAPYLSRLTQERLREAGVGYLDLTGNVRIVISAPGLFIEAEGAREDPERSERPALSMRGAKARRVARALIDRKVPPGVRELSSLTKVDAGYVSRVLALLDKEALVTRVGHGRMESVDWPGLLRYCAQQAPLESRGEARTYLEPRGLSTLVGRLVKSDERYALTGGLASEGFAPTAPVRLATVWVRDAVEAARRLGLRPAESGANVLFIEPDDEGIFEGAIQRDGVWYVAPSQTAMDLLTSPGRGPAEGEELIRWMLENEEKWRK